MTKCADHTEVYQQFLQDIEANSVDERLATPHYVQRCKQIQEDARARNRYDFIRWPSVQDFSAPEEWIPPECYDDLRKSSDWNKRWSRLTRETNIGCPKNYSLDFGTSPMLVQHAYHLFRYEKATRKSLLECNVIFEVGGGYGSFCRLLRNAGFSGLHVIYDLPHMSSIQRLYLTLSGFTEVPRDKISKGDQHGFCLFGDDYLDKAFDFFKSSKSRIGFVATWSLSETPMSVRERIIPRFFKVCDQYLIAFQPVWETVNNVEYFSAFQTLCPKVKWLKEEMPRRVNPPSWYLFA